MDQHRTASMIPTRTATSRTMSEDSGAISAMRSGVSVCVAIPLPEGMSCRRTECLSKPLTSLFVKLGSIVGSYPLYFVVVPLLAGCVFGAGVKFLEQNEDNDFERQFTPSKGPAKEARDFVKENFIYDDNMFSEKRLHTIGHFASLIAVAVDGSNVLEPPALDEVILLNEKILNITVGTDRQGFHDLSDKINGETMTNIILDIVKSRRKLSKQIMYPVHIHHSKKVFLGSKLGGVTTYPNGTIISARALKLQYDLTCKESFAEPVTLWLREFKALAAEELNGGYISMSYFTSKSKQEEIDNHHTDGFPLFVITYALAISISVISCFRLDNVRTKVWMAIVGVSTSGLAVLSSFGLLLYIGVPFVITVANSPFIILGIALNNMFVMVSDWQHTNVKDSVPERMAHTYQESIMPITVTALTDVLKFFIGVTSDFPALQAFCWYTATSLCFCYIYTLSFLGACFALNGMREAGNRHWLTCMKIPSTKQENHSTAYNLCCVGGKYDQKTGTERKKGVGNFFKQSYGPFLVTPGVKTVVVLMYLCYLAVSIYGCFNIKQGVELYDLAQDNSHVTNFVKKEREYFSKYDLPVMVIVSEPFPYWDQNSREDLDKCINDFKALKFVDDEIYTSWLDSYLSYGEKYTLDLNDKEKFFQNLPNFLEQEPIFKQDLNVVGDEIVASRVFIQTINIHDASLEVEMLRGLRSTSKNCEAAELISFCKEFIYFDQYEVVVYSIIKNVCVITALMLVISLLLIPDPICSLLVTCSISSGTVGVTGFMALWNISLDSISMIIFTVCIGFTVDFSAHVSYAYVLSKKETPNDRVIDALSCLGYPILQGAFSTILGLSVLIWSDFHTFRTFFQIFFLVVFIGMIHGLVFIPVALTLVQCSSPKPEDEKPELMTKL